MNDTEPDRKKIKALNEAFNYLKLADVVKICPVCGDFFCQITKKEKIYCTPRCQNTVSLLKFREKLS